MKSLYTLTLIMFALVSHFCFAQDSPELKLSGPGNYNLSHDSVQMETRTFDVTGLPVDIRGNLSNYFTSMLKRDGNGGVARVGKQKINGKEIILLSVTATKPMLETIKQEVVDKINRGEFSGFACGVQSVHIRCQYVSAERMAKLLKCELTGIGLVYFDAELNQVTVEDDPTLLPYLITVAEEYDRPSAQAKVEVIAMETRKGLDRDLGIYLDAWKKAFPSSASATMTGGRNVLGSLEITGFQAVVNNFSPKALTEFVNIMETKGVAEVRSRTTLNVVNGRPANFRAGVDRPYRLLAKEGSTNELENRTSFEGLELLIQSVIGEKGMNMEVKATSTSVIGYAENGGPMLSTSVVCTSVNVEGEKTFVLSGLETTHKVKTAWGVPLISRIPVLGYLFKREVSTDEKWDVSIIIHVKNS